MQRKRPAPHMRPLRTGGIEPCQWPECGHPASVEVVRADGTVQGRYCEEHARLVDNPHYDKVPPGYAAEAPSKREVADKDA